MKVISQRLAELLADAEVFTDGDWVESKDQDPNGDIRLVQMADIGVGKYLDKSAKFLNAATAARLKCTPLQAGDILVSRMPDPIGRACIFPGDIKKCVTVVDVCILRPNKSAVESRWLMHWFNSRVAQLQIERLATGTTRKRVSRSNIGRLEIEVPSLPEQRRIAAILDHADALRAYRDMTLRRIEHLKAAIFFKFFGDPGSTDRWPRMPLVEACHAIIDCPHSTPKWTEAGAICLRTPNLGKGRWVWNDTRFVSQEDFEARSKRGYLQNGDIVLSREGTVGIAAIVPPESRMCMGQRLVQVRPNPDIVLEAYLLDLLLYELDPKRISRVMVGSTATHLNVKELRSLSIPVPPIETQHKFVEARSSVEHMQDTNECDSTRMDEMFQSLQQRAFGGHL